MRDQEAYERICPIATPTGQKARNDLAVCQFGHGVSWKASV
jgi:hypothetical protein